MWRDTMVAAVGWAMPTVALGVMVEGAEKQGVTIDEAVQMAYERK